ncbi:MAG: 4Fe-4S dicluster domain-containing protein [Deltaproteobacteria bacterium]|nr:4Fe-4S dicluster domain-containing protein [Deltaproteobacteria bacterium]
MKKWFESLSGSQKIWFGTALILIFAAVLSTFIIVPSKTKVPEDFFTVQKTIRQMAPKLGVTGKALARELGLKITVSKSVPVSQLGVKQDKLNSSVEHLQSHRDASSKYILYSALVLGAIIFLLRIGIPDKADVKSRKLWYPSMFYISFLVISVLFAGFILGKSPNPMEGIVKVFKAMVGLYPDVMSKILAFVFFSVLSITANKILCGWACPMGSMQELLFFIPGLKKIRRYKIPFIFSNSIRILLFIIMFMLILGVIGGKPGFVLYHHLNAFDIFGFHFDSLSILITTIAVLILSFFIYRPFCAFICPFGLYSWILEQFSFARVRVDHDACTDCGACSRVCPTQSAAAKVAKKAIQPDCFSCTRCLNVCPHNAIRYTTPLKKNSKLPNKSES